MRDQRLADLVPDYIPRRPDDTNLSQVPRTLINPYSGHQFAYVPHGLDLPLDANLRNGRLPANTPLFWSTGIDNANPMRADYKYFDNDDKVPNAEPIERQMSVYRFLAPGNGWADALIFPLRK